MRVEELLHHAAPRQRVADEHMFSVDYGAQLPATMRLQVFTAPGTRPVMVAIQTINEGPSLTNGAETYFAAAWRRFCPEESRPPLWIQRLIFPGDGSADDDGCDFGSFDLVTFEEAAPYSASRPAWWPLTGDDELARLVGGPVDRGRGDGYVPRPPEPEQEPRFRVFPVARLPRPSTFRAPRCMPASGISRMQRTARQLRPRPAARDCCWYHGGAWAVVTRVAIDLLHQAQREGVAACDIIGRVGELVREAELSAWEHRALFTLVMDPIWLLAGGRGFGNGSHRSQAMLDQGVRRTLIVEYVDPPNLAEAQAALRAWAAEHTPR